MHKRIKSLVDRDRKILMDFSEKAGCTIATKMFFRHMGLLEEALDYSKWIHDYRMHVFYKNNPVTIESLIEEDYFKFKVVRNPYSRVISSYIRVMSDPLLQKDLKRFPWSKVNEYSFADFVSYLERVDVASIDTHNGQQKKYYEYDYENCFHEVVKLEEIIDRMNEINHKHGFDFDLKGLTSFHHINKKEERKGDFSKAKWSTIVNKVPRYVYFYTDDLKERVYNIFKDDFDAYHYTFEDFEREN